MGVQFPDLQVLMPRADEIARMPSAAHQQDAHQQSLAMAMKVESDRRRQRVTGAGAGSRAGRTARRSDERPAASSVPRTPTRPDGLGHRVDVRA